jgi:catechol 2,3-dioxygenase-like lactoylglutathione lyase family enzyme
MAALIQNTIPVLASLDLNETVTFYTERLGFATQMHIDNYVIVGRDGSEIHFWLCNERHVAENTSCYVRVVDTQALFDEFKSRGLSIEPPEVRPWGMKELYVIDPHGNLLKFGESA